MVEYNGATTRDYSVDKPVVNRAELNSLISGPGNRLVTHGDSLDRGDSDEAPIAGKTNISIQQSWPTFAAMISDYQINLVKNTGITANTTAMMLARFDADVTPYKPTIVTLGGGTNDIIQGIPFETYKTNFITMIDKIRAIDAVPVIRSLLPINAFRQTAATWFKWQKAYAEANGIVFMDFYTPLVRPDTGLLNTTAASGDGVHPGLGGILALATIARNILTPLMGVNKPSILTDNVDTDSILANPLFYGTVTGGLAASWSMQLQPAGATFSVGTDAGALGNVQIIQRDNTASDTIIQQGVGLAGNQKVAVGERIQVSGRLWTGAYLGTKAGNDIIRLDFGDGNPRNLYIGSAYLDSWSRFHKELIVPQGATQVKFMYLGNAGSGIAKLGQVSVLNATRLGTEIGIAF